MQCFGQECNFVDKGLCQADFPPSPPAEEATARRDQHRGPEPAIGPGTLLSVQSRNVVWKTGEPRDTRPNPPTEFRTVAIERCRLANSRSGIHRRRPGVGIRAHRVHWSIPSPGVLQSFMRWRSRLGALGYPIHHLTSAQLGLLVGTVVWGALESADIGVGVVWRPSAATFSLTRLLADAAAWRRSAWTGLGTNRGGESTGELSVCTATVGAGSP